MPVRCLIVDDNPGFLRAASALLERQGITVIGTASTGAQACRTCRQLQPDVVLLDIDLGPETGFHVARELARQATAPPPRIILISAHTADEFDDMIAATPALSFLPKVALSATAILDIIASADRAAAAGGPQRDSR